MEVYLLKYLAAAADVALIAYGMFAAYSLKTLISHHGRLMFLEIHHERRKEGREKEGA